MLTKQITLVALLLVDNKEADVIFYYDSESIASSDNNVKVWIKLVYENCEFKDHEKHLFELSCPENKFRVLEEFLYLKEGWSTEKYGKNQRIQKRSSPSNWQFVEPDTVGMVIQKKFCHF